MVEASLNFRLTVYLLKPFGLNGERTATNRKYCSVECGARVFKAIYLTFALSYYSLAHAPPNMNVVKAV